LIKQLYCHRPNTPEPVEALHKFRENGQNPDLDDLRNALLATIRGFSGVYIVLDALDEFAIEASDRKKLLDFIRQIHRSDLEKLHILCTSRREVDIEKTFKPLFTTPLAGNIDVDLLSYRRKLDYDIGLHIDDTLASEAFDDWPEELKKEGKQALVEKADGMYVLSRNSIPSSQPLIIVNKDSCLGFNMSHVNLTLFKACQVPVPFERL
jgi:hypothetical protein